ncbi:hypothetical protein MMC25_003166 [Agyrium rufum]|nr:hypothetical protein [Agyrium rufum]
MRIRRRPISLSILILQLISLSAAAITLEDVQDQVEGKAPQRSLVDSTASSSLSSLLKATHVPDINVPYDGKDGKPHAGPFIETAAQRDRKKAQEKGTEEKIGTAKKPAPKDAAKGSRPVDPATPKSNDGVMDDPNHVGPKEGTRGTEGGVTEKNRNKQYEESKVGEKSEKKPEAPKEAPPLPHSEEQIKQDRIEETVKLDKEKAAQQDEEDQVVKDVGGLEKPIDLPDTPHSIPHPQNPHSPTDPLHITNPVTSSNSLSDSLTTKANIIEPFHSFLLSFTMIIFSEIGDKTFLVAALMAMKYDRLLVFSAALGALIPMTVGSAIFGHAVPSLIPKRLTSFLAAGLFLVFGAKMLKEGLAIPPSQGVSEEMREVESEMEEKEALAARQQRRRSSVSPYILESGRVTGTRKTRSTSRLPSPPESPPDSPRSPSPSQRGALSSISSAIGGISNLFSLLLSPAWVQTWAMTFLGEWGDRSQIATIAMAAGQDYWWVTLGAVTGHSICTAVAVIGGRAIAGKVSLRVVTLGGAGAFLVFGFIYFIEAMYYSL